MAPKEQFLALSGAVSTYSGRKVLRRGDSLPVDVEPGEAERLRALGAYGYPDTRPADDRDEAQVLADDLAAQVAEEEGIEPEPVDPGDEPETEEEEEGPEPEEDRVGLEAYLKAASIEEVLDRVDDDPELATVLLEIESAAEEPREPLVAGLRSLLGVEPEEVTEPATGEPAGSTEPQEPQGAQPVDYSGWKAPQLKEELKRRGIEFKPVGVKNAELVALLEADDAKSA